MNESGSAVGVSVFVAHARDVSSEARERFATDVAGLRGNPRVILLHTCHRVELYVASDAGIQSNGDAPDLMVPRLPLGGRVLHGSEAARHLFTVAAGLDSIVVGEDQVLHQVRECLAERQLSALEETGERCTEGRRGRLAPERPGELAPILDRLFQLALHVGRQTRSWREELPGSLADVALDRIETRGSVRDRTVLIVGAGQMSRLSAMAAAHRGAAVVITNRTPERGARLAADVGGTTIPFGSVPPDVSGVIVAVGGEWLLDDAAATGLAQSPATVVDLSSPLAVGTTLRDVLGDRFISVDDVARSPIGASRPRYRHRVERLLDDAVAELTRWAATRDGVPAIVALTERAEARRAAEVERLVRRLPELTEHERDLVERMSHHLVAGILHAPLNSLHDDQDGARDRAARDLFGL